MQMMADYIGRRAIDRTIVAVPFNFGYKSVLLNFLCRLAELEITNYVAIALDAEAWRYVRSMNTRRSARVDY
jgi:hypothetical protein